MKPASREERAKAIAAAGGFSVDLVRAWYGAAWPVERRQLLEAEPLGEVAAWIDANAWEGVREGEGA